MRFGGRALSLVGRSAGFQSASLHSLRRPLMGSVERLTWSPMGHAAVARRSFSSDVIPIIDKENLQKRMQDAEPYLLIDVREPHELPYGVIPSSVNIPLRDIPIAFGLRPGEFQRKYGVPKPKPDTEMIFYCRAGPRAMSAAQNVNAMGFERTVCYYGSFQDWFNSSYPV